MSRTLLSEMPGRLGQVGVDRGGGDVDVAEQDLDDPGIDAALEKPGRIAVPERMRRDPAAGCRPPGRRPGRCGTEHCWLTGLVPTRLGNSQRGLRCVRQRRRRSSRTGCGSGTRRSLSPLPMMRSSRLAPSIAVTSRVVASLMRRPQAYMTAQARLVDRVPYAAQQSADLSVRQDDGQALLPGRANLFFQNSGQSRSSVRR